MRQLVQNLHFQPIPWSLVKFPPDPTPTALSPPNDHHTFSHPFTIPTKVYNVALKAEVPITIALSYAITAILLNRYNVRRGNKPWSISRTKAFYWFVIAHNVFLAVYSAWTFLGMFNALRSSMPSFHEDNGLVKTVDALCKINGPRGLGSAITYNSTREAWGTLNRFVHLDANALPASSDVGRIWNEGLSFYGWIFYLSKFYEVLDTLIILAKGKRSSTLQTYHHAGAMLSMWAGMRYMAPPIWMFVFVNSGIHAMMYTYYTLTALGFKIPSRIKRTLTTLQIIQFLVGTVFAFSHLFVAYQVPVSVPYVYSLANLTSAVSSDVSSVVSSATSTATAGVGSWIKKFALRAAGAEGIAENIENEQGETFGVDAVHAVQDLKNREEIRYRDEFQLVHCTDTSGQAFAILFNCFYLLPLTVLFVRFFVKSYIRRIEKRRNSTTLHVAEKSARDAGKGFARQLMEDIGNMHGTDEPASSPAAEVKEKLEHLKDINKQIESITGDVKGTLKDIKESQGPIEDLKKGNA